MKSENSIVQSKEGNEGHNELRDLQVGPRGSYGPSAQIVFYCISCAVGLSVIPLSLELGLGSSRELGPGLLPFIAGLVVLVTSLALLVTTLFRIKRTVAPAPAEGLGREASLRVMAILASLAGWPLLSSAVGYVIPTFLVSLCIAKATGYRGWRGPITLSCCIGLGIWILFSRVFSTDLPAGFRF
jgi:hypothetical protein